MKVALFHLFSQFGEILEILTKKTVKMRGQAFIVFKDLPSASEAMRCLNKTNFFGKDLVHKKTKNPKMIVWLR